jgi:hypothetical protein
VNENDVKCSLALAIDSIPIETSALFDSASDERAIHPDFLDLRVLSYAYQLREPEALWQPGLALSHYTSHTWAQAPIEVAVGAGNGSLARKLSHREAHSHR